MRQKHQGLRINVLQSLTYILNYLVATDNEDGSETDRVTNDSYPKQNWIFVFPNGFAAKINFPLFDWNNENLKIDSRRNDPKGPSHYLWNIELKIAFQDAEAEECRQRKQ